MKRIFLFLLPLGLFMACQQGPNHNFQDTSAEAPAVTAASDAWLESLITATPQEGRELAILMARKTIGAIQGNADVKKKLRGQYSENAQDLILSAQVVATEFQTVAEANNYWRD